MKWTVIPIAFVAAVNAVVLVSVAREGAAPAAFATIDVCRGEVQGGGTSNEPPDLLLRRAADSLTPRGLDSAGLRALGFSEAVIAAIGRPRDSTFRWPRPRPAWVLLRQEAKSASLERFVVVAVAPRRDGLVPDSTSLLLRGRVGISDHPFVAELIPSSLHLDREQSTALHHAAASVGCGRVGSVVIASGAYGGIWVQSVTASGSK